MNQQRQQNNDPVNPLSVHCPLCHAGPGWGCRDRSTRRRRDTQRNRDEVHEQRKDAVIKKAAKHYQR